MVVYAVAVRAKTKDLAAFVEHCPLLAVHFIYEDFFTDVSIDNSVLSVLILLHGNSLQLTSRSMSPRL